MKVLHRKERADAHPIGDLQGDKAIGKALLPLERWWNQRATGQGLRDPLRILKRLDAAEHRAA
jgi:hypothetical protein